VIEFAKEQDLPEVRALLSLTLRYVSPQATVPARRCS
jgi:hypothetical protein